jgi:hypothetical protein
MNERDLLKRKILLDALRNYFDDCTAPMAVCEDLVIELMEDNDFHEEAKEARNDARIKWQHS